MKLYVAFDFIRLVNMGARLQATVTVEEGKRALSSKGGLPKHPWFASLTRV